MHYRIGMEGIHKIIRRLVNKIKRVLVFFLNYLCNILPDKLFLQAKFYLHLGYWPNLKNPKSFNEKLQYLKLYSKNHPEYSQMVDKVGAKDFVASIIGDEYIIPTYGIWESVDEIDWESLPKQFVIKNAGDSGGVLVCKNKEEIDIGYYKKVLKQHNNCEYWKKTKEYPYKNVPHRVIAEKYLKGKTGESLKDYKFFCFNGEPSFLYVSQGLDNHSTAKITFLNVDWTLAAFSRADYMSLVELPQKPENYDLMLDLARKLSAGLPHVRVDFYNIDGCVFFGELTFFTCSGMIPFTPADWDFKLGKLIECPIE